MYKQIMDRNGKSCSHVIMRDTDNAWIPCDPDNRDYQEFMDYCGKNKTSLDKFDVKDVKKD